MKNIILVSLIFLTGSLKAQAYIPMPFENGMLWRSFFQVASGAWFAEHRVSNDTLIGANTYKKIVYSWYYTNPILPTIGGPGLVREDTLNKIVYLYESGTDKILYDFSLNIGDTIHSTMLSYYQFLGTDTIRIDKIDSIAINGVFHKRFTSTEIQPGLTPAITYVYIEGIGSTAGLLQMCGWFECGSNLECVGKYYNQSLYPDSLFTCIYATGLNPIIKTDDISAYPNPAKNKFIISSMSKLSDIKIYSVTSSLIFELQNIETNFIELDISKYKPGIYFVKINKSDYKKLIVD